MKICTFLWIYYGYPSSTYEGISVERMRYNCGAALAKRDSGTIHPDIVAGVPDSGVAHAIGYANESGIPYSRPFIKYTPTWPRSFMPTNQEQRNLIARMKLIPVQALIDQKKLLLIDDSIVRGTTSARIVSLLKNAGAAEVHVRISSPPFKHPSDFGTDIPSEDQLIASGHTVDEICKLIGADSLGYLEVDRLSEMINGQKDYCEACFTGNYPIEPPTQDIRGEMG